MVSVPKPSHKRRVPKRKYRNEFSPAIKEKIREKFNHQCQECGGPARDIHHVHPRGRSGRAVESNALLLCRACHENIHRHPEREKYWEEQYKKQFGQHYFRDRYDLEAMIIQREITERDKEIEKWLRVNG